MGSLQTDFDGLKLAVFAHCDRGDTGTLFVATGDNRSAQIVLFKGGLQGIACSGEYNAEALSSLAEQSQLKCSFTPELVYPVPETLLPEQGQALLESLGYQPGKAVISASEQASEPARVSAGRAGSAATKSPPSSVTLRVYRGQVIRS